MQPSMRALAVAQTTPRQAGMLAFAWGSATQAGASQAQFLRCRSSPLYRRWTRSLSLVNRAGCTQGNIGVQAGRPERWPGGDSNTMEKWTMKINPAPMSRRRRGAMLSVKPAKAYGSGRIMVFVRALRRRNASLA